jgi:hypothetical protein
MVTGFRVIGDEEQVIPEIRARLRRVLGETTDF